MLSEAWRAARHERGLWGFGVISALSRSFAAVMLGGVTSVLIASVVLMQLVTSLESSGDAAAVDAFSEATIAVSAFADRYSVALLSGATFVFAVWMVLAILDVAALGGLVHQSAAVTRGRRASAGTGLAVGWRCWWRVAALYAIAALPALASLAVTAFAVWIPVVAASAHGGLDPSAQIAATNMSQPITSLISLIAIPLGIIVEFALRYAVVDDEEWAVSLRSSWGLLKGHLEQAVLFVLVMWLVSLAFAVVSAIPAVVAGSALLGVVLADTGTPVLVAAGAVGALAAVFFVMLNAGFTVFRQLAITLAWRRLAEMPDKANAYPTPTDYAAAARLDGVPPASPAQDGRPA